MGARVRDKDARWHDSSVRLCGKDVEGYIRMFDNAARVIGWLRSNALMRGEAQEV